MNTNPDTGNSGPQLRPHVYDGIQEYDQKLPNWWLFTLYIAIVAFVIYWVGYYQLGIGSTDTATVDAVIARIDKAREQAVQGIDDARLWAMSKDPQIVAAGKATFMTPGMCVTCHGPDLSGKLMGAKLPGLPLNDTEWKHGGKPTEIFKLVRKGAPDITKGMPAWEPALGVKRVSEVVAYVLSFHKEGEPVTPAPDAPAQGAPAASAPPAGTIPSATAPTTPAQPSPSPPPAAAPPAVPANPTTK